MDHQSTPHITFNCQKREKSIGITHSQHEGSQDATGFSEWNYLCKFCMMLASCRPHTLAKTFCHIGRRTQLTLITDASSKHPIYVTVPVFPCIQ